MGKQTPQAPAAPDPVALSNAQGAANKDTAIAQARLGAVSTNSPFGSVTYTETPNPNDPSVPSFTQNTVLSPQQQKLYDTQQGITQQAYNTAGQAIGNVQDTLSKPFSLDGLPALQTGVQGSQISQGYGAVNPLFGIAPGGKIQSGIDTNGIQQTPLSANDFVQQGQQVQDALMSRFNQDIGKRQEDVESRLNAQGIQRGSAGFANAQDDLSRARNDALSQAILGGSQQQNQLFGQQLAANQNLFGQREAQGNFGNQAQSQQFGQNATQQQAYNQAAAQATGNNAAQAAFGNTAQQQAFQQGQSNVGLNNQARQQGIAEQQLVRSQPINEIATLLGLGGGINVPQAAPNFGVNIGQTDVLGAYGLQQQAQQNQYNQQMQANNSLWGGLSNLGGALGGAWIMSDARSKNIIRRVGQTATGTPLYLYEYRHDPGRQIVGVMAQDVQRVNPLAVHDIGGILHVDMAMVA